ncbi:OmpA family protein [Azovibrio restrictus]|uniref:OmpA family protein n=1 Tax=Azovibrio restrictus TaxID=146938 RepID=UPI0026F1EF86|nr:OmpA family protein [Azovibrio restrictus]MDD3482571.1 OmpA family protein [Azovibrio restrictus]
MPDAVYTLEPGSDTLPSPVNQSLQEFAARMKANRDLVIRLESFVPSGGSREMNISLSSSAVERVRRRLVELGVPSYRIKQTPLGEEHPDSPQLNNRRVELFLIHLPR